MDQRLLQSTCRNAKAASRTTCRRRRSRCRRADSSAPFDFFLTFYLIGEEKNKYGFIAGNLYGNLRFRATGDLHGDGSSAAITYFWIGSSELEFFAPGRPGAKRLTGSESARGDSVNWTLTRKYGVAPGRLPTKTPPPKGRRLEEPAATYSPRRLPTKYHRR